MNLMKNIIKSVLLLFFQAFDEPWKGAAYRLSSKASPTLAT
ncbi:MULTISPECIES: hypothetical protein [unclassified Vibrio]|nr:MULTISPECIES: hypothetical protein [unclassified Vibrio]